MVFSTGKWKWCCLSCRAVEGIKWYELNRAQLYNKWQQWSLFRPLTSHAQHPVQYTITTFSVTHFHTQYHTQLSFLTPGRHSITPNWLPLPEAPGDQANCFYQGWMSPRGPTKLYHGRRLAFQLTWKWNKHSFQSSKQPGTSPSHLITLPSICNYGRASRQCCSSKDGPHQYFWSTWNHVSAQENPCPCEIYRPIF